MARSTDVERITLPPTVVEDGQQVHNAITQRILAADSLQGIFEDQKTLSLDDIEGEPVTIDQISFHESADEFKENSLGVFMVMRLDDERIVTTGAQTPTVKLYQVCKLVQDGKVEDPFPIMVTFNKAKRATKRGYLPWDVTLITG